MNGVTTYTITVDSEAHYIYLTPTVSFKCNPENQFQCASVTVDGMPVASGNSSSALPLREGDITHISVVVTAQDPALDSWSPTPPPMF